MSRPADSQYSVEPSIARMTEEAAKQKTVGTQEKRELVGEGDFKERHEGAFTNKNALLDNPLQGISLERLESMGRAFAREKGLEEFEEEFAKGAQVAQDPLAFESLTLLTMPTATCFAAKSCVTQLPRVFTFAATCCAVQTHKWHQPWKLYALTICCSMAAAVQGMDESVTNGANLFWPQQFGIDAAARDNDAWVLGFINGAPYLCCGILGCWLSAPLNRAFGRRGTIFITALFSALTCVWMACVNSKWHLFASRFVLGLGIGPKSATVPVYAAETAPPIIRGALIMIGTATSLMFFRVPDPSGVAITGLNWRLMLGSAAVPAFLVMAQVYFCPESPRWLISRNRYREAFESLCRLRHTKLQAARDLFMINALLEEEASLVTGKLAIVELFSVARNRRAAIASGVVMYMQQFCGINVIAYYSATIFREAGFDDITALGATLAFGILNWLMAAPAVWTIDTFGRRNLLLSTFPLMSIFLLMAGMAFYIPAGSGRTAVVALGVYLHCMAYSPGEGPVPFVYAAESFPLYVRDVGMSYATAVTWIFNFIVAFTFPRLLTAFTPQGAFGWYAGWNAIGTFLVFFFVPETKSLSLEELDAVFSIPTAQHCSYNIAGLGYNFRKYILRQRLPPRAPLYAWDVKA